MLFDSFRESLQRLSKLLLRADILDRALEGRLVVCWIRSDLLWRQSLQLSLNTVEKVLNTSQGSQLTVSASEVVQLTIDLPKERRSTALT
jgi:hypothetical protein